MKYLVLILQILFLLSVQNALSHLGLGPVGNLLLILVIVATVFESYKFALTTAVISGLTLDLTSSTLDSTLILAMVGTFAFVYYMVNNLLSRQEDWVILLATVGMSTIVFSLLVVLVNKIFGIINLGMYLDLGFIFGRKLILDLVFNLLLAYPVFYFQLLVKRFEIRYIL